MEFLTSWQGGALLAFYVAVFVAAIIHLWKNR